MDSIMKSAASPSAKAAGHGRSVRSLDETACHELEHLLGHTFKNPDLLWEALQAAGNGIRKIGDRTVEDGNKKLALLGDSVLQVAILIDWFATGESRKAGHDFSVGIGNNHNLSKCGRAAGLEKYINPNRNFKNTATGSKEIPSGTMASTVEALLGAVFKDSGESLHTVKVAMQGLGLLTKEFCKRGRSSQQAGGQQTSIQGQEEATHVGC